MQNPTFVNSPVVLPCANRQRRPKLIDAPRMQQAAASTTVIPGISGIASSYKCFLLDQFGVIHDGQRVYPGAVRVLNELHKAGKKTIILSNSSRRASSTVRALQRKAIDPDLIDAVVTSGELAFSALPVFAAAHPTARVLHFNWGSTSRSAVSIVDHGLTCIAPPSRTLHGCNVPKASDVDVIVAHGTTGITLPSPRDAVLDVPWQVANDLLVEIASLNPHTPFFVANPDIVTVDGAELRPMPGALAKIFQDAGGDNIHRLGKPDPVAYTEALRLADVQPSDVLAVGDSLAHDILGAADAGIDSL